MRAFDQDEMMVARKPGVTTSPRRFSVSVNPAVPVVTGTTADQLVSSPGDMEQETKEPEPTQCTPESGPNISNPERRGSSGDLHKIVSPQSGRKWKNPNEGAATEAPSSPAASGPDDGRGGAEGEQ